eukprot:3452562-Rhodomonas_salina.2
MLRAGPGAETPHCYLPTQHPVLTCRMRASRFAGGDPYSARVSREVVAKSPRDSAKMPPPVEEDDVLGNVLQMNARPCPVWVLRDAERSAELTRRVAGQEETSQERDVAEEEEEEEDKVESAVVAAVDAADAADTATDAVNAVSDTADTAAETANTVADAADTVADATDTVADAANTAADTAEGGKACMRHARARAAKSGTEGGRLQARIRRIRGWMRKMREMREMRWPQR